MNTCFVHEKNEHMFINVHINMEMNMEVIMKMHMEMNIENLRLSLSIQGIRPPHDLKQNSLLM